MFLHHDLFFKKEENKEEEENEGIHRPRKLILPKQSEILAGSEKSSRARASGGDGVD
jgi:hypothetical protein